MRWIPVGEYSAGHSGNNCASPYFRVLCSIFLILWGADLLLAQKQRQVRKKPSSSHVVFYGVESTIFDNGYDKRWREIISSSPSKDYLITYYNKEGLVAGILEGLHKTLRAGKTAPINELRIYGHGKPGLIGTGRGQGPFYVHSTFIASSNVYWGEANDWPEAFEAIKGRFAVGAVISLYGCSAGEDSDGALLVWQLAKYFGVKVRAAIGLVDGGQEPDCWQTATPEMPEPPPPVPGPPPALNPLDGQSPHPEPARPDPTRLDKSPSGALRSNESLEFDPRTALGIS
jgi:hypothetical protein